MAKSPDVFPLRNLRGINTAAESTEIGNALQLAQNLMLRPSGGFKGIPKYFRLWGIGSSKSIADIITQDIPHPTNAPTASRAAFSLPSGATFAPSIGTLYVGKPISFSGSVPPELTVGAIYYVSEVLNTETFRVSATLGGSHVALTTGYGYTVNELARLTSSDNTVALQISRQGKSFLFFYSIPDSKCRGLFYLGDDNSFTSGTYDFTAGTPVYTVLATGLDATARWFGSRQYSAVCLGNGVDNNVIAQLGRTKTPGVWRTSGSNSKPGAPAISLINPANDENVQARWDVSGRAGGVTLSFVADPDNFPGASGNAKIRVQITNAGISVGLSSSLSGVGTTAQPYHYSLTAGTSALQSSNDAIKAFVNADSKALGIVSVESTANATADPASYGPTLLSSGSGSGSSAGFTSRTVTFYARYFDSGADNLGYEGPSSDISNTVIIDASINKDLQVLVPVDASADGGRFDQIRLYMQFGEELEASWFLMNPSSPVPNGLTEDFGTSDVDTGADEITLDGGQWAANDVVRFTSTTTLPSGISAATDYYLRPGSTAVKWKLSTTLDGTTYVNLTSTGTGTHTATLHKKCVRIGTNTPLGQEMSVDQNRPLPHQHHAMAVQQMWRAGVTGFQNRLYVSKPALDDELVPEGCALDAWEVVHLTSTVTADQRVTGLYSDSQQLHIHLPSGIMILRTPATDPTDRYESAVAAGALAGAAMAVYQRDGLYYYVGSDLRLYSAQLVGDGTQYGRLQSGVLDAATLQYVRERVNLDAIEQHPERACVFADPATEMVWYYLPGTDGTLTGFAFDLALGGLCGPFTYPKIYAQCRMEPNRPELVFADEDGNLFVWDTTDQDDRGDAFDAASAFTAYSTASLPPVQYNGYGYVDYDHDGDGTASRFYQAYETILETGMVDLGNAVQRKAFMTFLWRVVDNSRAFVEITLTSLSGQTLTLNYGDIGDLVRGDKRLPIRMSDTAVKVKMRIIGAEQKPWIIRDLALYYLPQSRV